MSQPTTGATTLLATPERIAAKMGLTLPLADDARAVLTEAILDVQADVQSHLGVPLFPVTVTEQHLRSYTDGWHLTGEWAAYRISVLSAVAEANLDGSPTGLFSVTYTAGLGDVVNDPEFEPIRRYVRAWAAVDPAVVRLWLSQGNRGEIKSVTAEGQSVSYGSAVAALGAGQSGNESRLPDKSTLDRWVCHAVYQKPGPPPRVPYYPSVFW
jgi:hypothetical protein